MNLHANAEQKRQAQVHDAVQAQLHTRVYKGLHACMAGHKYDIRRKSGCGS